MPKRIKPPEIKVIPKEGEDPAPIEIIEKSIIDIAAGMKALFKSRLTADTIQMLISWKSGVSRRDVYRVMECLANLEKKFLK